MSCLLCCFLISIFFTTIYHTHTHAMMEETVGCWFLSGPKDTVRTALVLIRGGHGGGGGGVVCSPQGIFKENFRGKSLRAQNILTQPAILRPSPPFKARQ